MRDHPLGWLRAVFALKYLKLDWIEYALKFVSYFQIYPFVHSIYILYACISAA